MTNRQHFRFIATLVLMLAGISGMLAFGIHHPGRKSIVRCAEMDIVK